MGNPPVPAGAGAHVGSAAAPTPSHELDVPGETAQAPQRGTSQYEHIANDEASRSFCNRVQGGLL